MPRTKSFDVDDVLDRAVELFWLRGYAATSIEDLVQGLGVNRRAIYSTFGSKEDLFELALGRYRQANTTMVAELVADRSVPLRDRVMAVLTAASTDDDHRGCFLQNTGAELGATNERLRALCSDGLADVQSLLLDAFEAHADALVADMAPAVAVDVIVVAMQGLRSIGTTDASIDVGAVIDRALDAVFGTD